MRPNKRYLSYTTCLCVVSISQDRDQRREERSVASHSGQRVDGDGGGGQGERAAHVQRCEPSLCQASGLTDQTIVGLVC